MDKLRMPTNRLPCGHPMSKTTYTAVLNLPPNTFFPCPHCGALTQVRTWRQAPHNTWREEPAPLTPALGLEHLCKPRTATELCAMLYPRRDGVG